MQDFYFMEAGKLHAHAVKLIDDVRMELNSAKKELSNLNAQEKKVKGKERFETREKIHELTEKLLEITEKTKWLNAISDQLAKVENSEQLIELSLRQLSLLNIPKEELAIQQLTIEDEIKEEKPAKKGKKKSA